MLPTDLIINGLKEGISIAFSMAMPLIAIAWGAYILCVCGIKIIKNVMSSSFPDLLPKIIYTVASVVMLYWGTLHMPFKTPGLFFTLILLGILGGLKSLID